MKHDLNEIKQDYQNIKVPDSLKQQVEYSIRMAKSSMGTENKSDGSQQKRKWPWPVWGCSGIVAAMLALTILANTNASITYAMGQIPLLKSIVEVITFREYEHQDGRMEADIKIPKIQVQDGDGNIQEDKSQKLNDSIQAYTDKMIAAYEADVKASGGKGVQAVDLDYEVVTDNDRLFSLQFHETITMAGASESEKIYHIDKESGEMITLKDLFQEGTDYKALISGNIKKQMKSQMEKDGSKIYWLDSEETEEWNFKEISDDVDFYINQSGKLTIVFDEYEVAPGYMGTVSFEIPTDVVIEAVKDEYKALLAL